MGTSSKIIKKHGPWESYNEISEYSHFERFPLNIILYSSVFCLPCPLKFDEIPALLKNNVINLRVCFVDVLSLGLNSRSIQSNSYNIISTSEIKGASGRERTFPCPGARFAQVCTQSVHIFLSDYYYYILGGCMEVFPGTQFNLKEKCTLQVHEIKP